MVFAVAAAWLVACTSRYTLAGGGGPVAARPTSTKAVAPGPWTPARVRTFVLRAEAEMEKLQSLQFPEGWDRRAPLDVGTCHENPIAGVIGKSFALPRLQAVLSASALGCYTATYLGCTVGAWIGRSIDSEYGPGTKPFTRSKVTIVEQTPNRVVADVVEADSEEVFDGVIAEWNDRIGKLVPYTDEELAQYKEVSRYTITLGADGVWRISDRKPPFEWECRAN
jgi:hypothetical protein